jgi:hypothetical protein
MLICEKILTALPMRAKFLNDNPDDNVAKFKIEQALPVRINALTLTLDAM